MNEKDRTAGRYARAYGALLIACALLTVFGVMHHPIVSSQDTASLLAGLARQQGAIAGLHSLLLILGMLQVVGLYGFSRQLDLAHPLTAAGLVLYGFGIVGMTNAGVINGFAAPAFAASLEGASPAQIEAAGVALKMNWALNQAWDRIATLVWCGAMFCWSIVLLGRTGLPRAAGILGLGAAISIAGAVTTGAVRFDVGGFLATVAALSVWTVAVALLMVTGRLGADPRATSSQL